MSSSEIETSAGSDSNVSAAPSSEPVSGASASGSACTASEPDHASSSGSGVQSRIKRWFHDGMEVTKKTAVEFEKGWREHVPVILNELEEHTNNAKDKVTGYIDKVENEKFIAFLENPTPGVLQRNPKFIVGVLKIMIALGHPQTERLQKIMEAANTRAHAASGASGTGSDATFSGAGSNTEGSNNKKSSKKKPAAKKGANKKGADKKGAKAKPSAKKGDKKDAAKGASAKKGGKKGGSTKAASKKGGKKGGSKKAAPAKGTASTKKGGKKGGSKKAVSKKGGKKGGKKKGGKAKVTDMKEAKKTVSGMTSNQMRKALLIVKDVGAKEDKSSD